jgi:beta-xylosidase
MKHARYLFPKDYMADPSANVFNGRLYIYPSHDWDSGASEDDDGGHFEMKDYHVLSLDDVENGKVIDHGVILTVEEIPWAGRQLWDNDVVEKNGNYYLIYCAKDKNDVFHLGVAIANKPEGPFIPQPDPIRGSYSIDPCVFKDDDGQIYVYFGGIWGGQLQRYNDNKALGKEHLPAGDEDALPSRVARMSDDMLQFAEDPRPVLVVDDNGNPLKADDPHRFFEASWMHK